MVEEQVLSCIIYAFIILVSHMFNIYLNILFNNIHFFLAFYLFKWWMLYYKLAEIWRNKLTKVFSWLVKWLVLQALIYISVYETFLYFIAYLLLP